MSTYGELMMKHEKFVDYLKDNIRRQKIDDASLAQITTDLSAACIKAFLEMSKEDQENKSDQSNWSSVTPTRDMYPPNSQNGIKDDGDVLLSLVKM